MQRFYINQGIEIVKNVTLPINVVQHLHVLRIKINQEIIVFNGDGYSYLAKLTYIDRKSAVVNVLSKHAHDCENHTAITLGLCLISGDKMDLAIQKAVELGVKTIVPLTSECSQRISQERILKRIEHWQNIIISSCEQCGGNKLPQLVEIASFKTFIKDVTKADLNLILSLNRKSFNLSDTKINDVNLIVGPEGGFSQDEIEYAEENNYVAVSLGTRVLRAETAVIAGLSWIKTLTGDF